MRYVWDAAKRRINIEKHGFDFADTAQLFAGNTVTVEDDCIDYGEQRFLPLGRLGSQVVVIVYRENMDSLRVITMRKALKYEAEIYFRGIRD